jgi:hypothetical protein
MRCTLGARAAYGFVHGPERLVILLPESEAPLEVFSGCRAQIHQVGDGSGASRKARYHSSINDPMPACDVHQAKIVCICLTRFSTSFASVSTICCFSVIWVI